MIDSMRKRFFHGLLCELAQATAPIPDSTAHLDDGVLTLALKKTKEAMPRTISIS
jgi:hypothetical protein